MSCDTRVISLTGCKVKVHDPAKPRWQLCSVCLEEFLFSADLFQPYRILQVSIICSPVVGNKWYSMAREPALFILFYFACTSVTTGSTYYL